MQKVTNAFLRRVWSANQLVFQLQKGLEKCIFIYE